MTYLYLLQVAQTLVPPGDAQAVATSEAAVCSLTELLSTALVAGAGASAAAEGFTSIIALSWASTWVAAALYIHWMGGGRWLERLHERGQWSRGSRRLARWRDRGVEQLGLRAGGWSWGPDLLARCEDSEEGCGDLSVWDDPESIDESLALAAEREREDGDGPPSVFERIDSGEWTEEGDFAW